MKTKFEEGKKMTPEQVAKLMICASNKPKITETDKGIWRRIWRVK